LALFLGCHEQAFHDFGGVPEEILYDRVKTVWLRDDDHGDPVFHPGFVDFAEHYGFRPKLCHPYRPQTKGKTENGIGYVRKNFWPRVRDYREAHDLLDLRRRWLDETCNVRIHGTTGERPIDRLPKEGLRSIEDLPPYRALVLERRRVARDCFVSYAGSWYSAPAEYTGRVRRRVQAYCSILLFAVMRRSPLCLNSFLWLNSFPDARVKGLVNTRRPT